MQAKQATACWEDAPCGLLVTSFEGRILAVNARLKHWLGGSSLVGMGFAELLTPAARAYYHWQVAPCIERHRRGDEIQLALAIHDDRLLPVLGGV